MTSINIDKSRIVQEIQNECPKIKKVQDIADVVLAALDLQASSTNTVTRWELQQHGAKPQAVQRAYKHKLLQKKGVGRQAYPTYDRGPTPRTDTEWRRALQRERPGLYRHIANDRRAKQIAEDVLGLPPTSSLAAIRNRMESGDTQHQVSLYRNVVSMLIARRIFDRRYDYVFLGWRNKANRYWLTDKATRIVQRSTP